MPVSGLKRINNPRNVITKHNNVDKVKIPKLSREKTGHMKNKELEMAHFSRQSLENGKLGRSSNGGDGVWGCRAICLPRTIRKAGKSFCFFLKCLWKYQRQKGPGGPKFQRQRETLRSVLKQFFLVIYQFASNGYTAKKLKSFWKSSVAQGSKLGHLVPIKEKGCWALSGNY